MVKPGPRSQEFHGQQPHPDKSFLVEAPQECWSPLPRWTAHETLTPVTCSVLTGPELNRDPLPQKTWGDCRVSVAVRSRGEQRPELQKGRGFPWSMWSGWASPWPLGDRALCARLGFHRESGLCAARLARGRKQREGDGAGALSRSQSPYCISLGGPSFPPKGGPGGASFAKGEVTRKLTVQGTWMVNHLGAARCYPA